MQNLKSILAGVILSILSIQFCDGSIWLCISSSIVQNTCNANIVVMKEITETTESNHKKGSINGSLYRDNIWADYIRGY